MSRSVHVRAPSRLHFGMFSFGHADRPQFGGVGVMIEPPTIDVTISPADTFTARGAHIKRVGRFAAAIASNWKLTAPPCCEIHVSAPPDHVGLGVGTQLGLAVATGLRQFLELPGLTTEELAQSVGRGARSAVGTHGFQSGGLIVDAGKPSNSPLGTIARRVALPGQWRFVLVRNAVNSRGLAGDREADAFARLPGVPQKVTDELWQITDNEMLPAIESSDCDAFGDAVYRFNLLAGECFAPVQGGPFASTRTAKLVETIRGLGVTGAGQSSWGPTVFAITPDDGKANELSEQIRGQMPCASCDITIASPNNSGAQVSEAI